MIAAHPREVTWSGARAVSGIHSRSTSPAARSRVSPPGAHSTALAESRLRHERGPLQRGWIRPSPQLEVSESLTAEMAKRI